jgi:NAD(P)-dependent dehydrogenase (short-subunit alcohol dehydrogenase family)
MLADGPPTLGTTTPGSTEPRANAPPRSVITITSANATLAAPDRAEYCFSKTALSMMVKIFAVRLGAAGIACYEVRPGVIRTDMTAVAAQKYDRLIGDGLTPIARWGEAGDVGRVVATLAAGDLPFVTGDAVHVDGGLHIHKL